MHQPDQFRLLMSSRWFVPLLALLGRERGARHAVLLNRLGLSRSMLRRSLDALIAVGWVARNPGHGHPLRPEYILTESGFAVGRLCEKMAEARAGLGLGPQSLGRWAVPLLLVMADDWRRFSQLQATLDPISPRSLSLALKQLVEQGLCDRRLDASSPPVPLYRSTNRGRALVQFLE